MAGAKLLNIEGRVIGEEWELVNILVGDTVRSSNKVVEILNYK